MEKLVIADVEEFKPQHPDCPECGNKMASQGNNWKCNRCGKYVVKKRREQKVLIGRPPCPDCKSTHVVSRGQEWRCSNCGRCFIKLRRTSEKTAPLKNK